MSNAVDSKASKRVDALLAEVAEAYRQLPHVRTLPAAFRESLAKHHLPGGYVRQGAIARALSQII